MPPVVDAHTHIFPPGIVADREPFRQRDDWFKYLYSHPKAYLATADDLLSEMETSGVDVSVACGFGWTDPALCAEHNEYLLKVAGRSGGRIVPFICIQPLSPAAVAEIDRCADMGAAGIGELMPNGQGFALDDEKVMAPIVAAAVRHGLPILTHASEPVGHSYPGKGTVTPEVILRFASRFPEATIICAHWGGGLPFYELMPEVRRSLRNVYYDTAAGLFLYRPEIYVSITAAAGPDKVLFGSDYPLIRQQRFLAHVRSSSLSEASIEQIIGANASRLLSLQREADDNP